MSESGYYAWKNRSPSQRAEQTQILKARSQMIWQRYGALRIHAELQAQVYQIASPVFGSSGKGGQKRRPRTTQSDAETEEGFLYTASVMDLCSRQRMMNAHIQKVCARECCSSASHPGEGDGI